MRNSRNISVVDDLSSQSVTFGLLNCQSAVNTAELICLAYGALGRTRRRYGRAHFERQDFCPTLFEEMQAEEFLFSFRPQRS